MQPVSNSAALWQRPTAGQETLLRMKPRNVSLCRSEATEDGASATERKIRVKEAREGAWRGREGARGCAKESQRAWKAMEGLRGVSEKTIIQSNNTDNHHDLVLLDVFEMTNELHFIV